jgi:endonuclease/exonuclease/phosphatase family metal-dependent hydrolase
MFGRALVKWFIVASNAVAVIFLLITILASVLSPEKIVFPAYFGLFFPLTIAVNIGFVIFWLIVRKWFFLLSLSVLFFSASQINNTFPVHFGKKTTEVHSRPIQFLTYNTKMTGSLKKHTRRNHNDVIQYILDTNADIVCLQEFTVSDKKQYLTLKDINRIFVKYPYKHIKFKEKSKLNTKWFGVATFSKYPIVNKQTIDYPSNYNVAIYSDIDINGKTIRLINNHLESNRLTEDDKSMPRKLKDKFNTDELTDITVHFSQKLGMAYKIRAYQADVVSNIISQSPYKVIVCGDLNDVPSSYAYTKLKGNLKDAFAETGTGLGWTFNDRYYHFRIDYVFYDATAFTPIEYKADKVNYSDHYPVLCQLEINKI